MTDHPEDGIAQRSERRRHGCGSLIAVACLAHSCGGASTSELGDIEVRLTEFKRAIELADRALLSRGTAADLPPSGFLRRAKTARHSRTAPGASLRECTHRVSRSRRQKDESHPT